MSENLYSNIKSCRVDTNPLNPSDHKEVVMEIDYNPTSVIEVWFVCALDADLGVSRDCRGPKWRGPIT